MPPRKMHQTTVRFGPDLWRALEDECGRLGVSVAQFLRESALARLMYAAGRRGDDEFELALDIAAGAGTEGARAPARAAGRPTRAAVMSRALSESSGSSAVTAQSRLARERAAKLREQVARARATRPPLGPPTR